MAMMLLLLRALTGALLASVGEGSALTSGLRAGQGTACGRGTGRLCVNSTAKVSPLPSFYHTTSGIHDELVALASKCPALALRQEQEAGSDRAIDVVTVRDPTAQPKNRVFLLFGEHARELISPESGLHFVKTLCGASDLPPARAAEVLQGSEFMIVVNGNPGSRQKVEAGNFCVRENPDGVDLNRNWDVKWLSDSELPQTNPGSSPFCEPETRIFKRLVTEFKPTTFLTIHSGTKGMYMPWAYDTEHLATRNQPAMMQILESLDRDHCKCPFGAAGKEVGYSCPGTCLDWVYSELKAPFAFAFEIYGGAESDEELRQRWKEKVQSEEGSFLQRNSHLGHAHFGDFFTEHPSCFVQTRASSTNRHMSNFDCFRNFNPSTKAEFEEVLRNWSGAYLDMASQVVSRLAATATESDVVKADPVAELQTLRAAMAVDAAGGASRFGG